MLLVLHLIPACSPACEQGETNEPWDVPIEWESCDNYDVTSHLGTGKYSHVLAGVRRADNRTVALKVRRLLDPHFRIPVHPISQSRRIT